MAIWDIEGLWRLHGDIAKIRDKLKYTPYVRVGYKNEPYDVWRTKNGFTVQDKYGNNEYGDDFAVMIRSFATASEKKRAK